MKDLEHIKSRVEREIEEVMGEKKWTPQHAQVIEELLNCEKCIKEIEKLAHAKKRMMGLPVPTEEEDEEMMEKPWHFNMYRNRIGRGRINYNYERGRDGYEPYDYTYEDDYDFENRGRRERNSYHYDPEYLIWLKKKKHYKKDWEDDDDDDEEKEEKLMKKMKKLMKEMGMEKESFPHYNYTGSGTQGQSGNSQTGNQGQSTPPTGVVGK